MMPLLSSLKRQGSSAQRPGSASSTGSMGARPLTPCGQDQGQRPSSAGSGSCLNRQRTALLPADTSTVGGAGGQAQLLRSRTSLLAAAEMLVAAPLPMSTPRGGAEGGTEGSSAMVRRQRTSILEEVEEQPAQRAHRPQSLPRRQRTSLLVEDVEDSSLQ
uniref:Uncharacterized protein n=1 Tax=Pyrodinium bahamense TaxID=73915 RepID=A0A7S0A0F9_9DINO|mmetsp:Transcript_16834/g.46405  ORF Transcript_16834/g.46405 Transcript_16834/m.46405 type:complete len:160 (+) Transcript_16834:80-559(+)